MPYLKPPTFGNHILSAAHLQVLSNNTEDLKGRIDAPVFGMGAYIRNGSALEGPGPSPAANNKWIVRHKYDNFHYRIRLNAGDIDDLDIYYGGQLLVDLVASTESAPQVYTGSVDLTTLGTPPTTDNWYEVSLDSSQSGGSQEIAVEYLIEADSTSLAMTGGSTAYATPRQWTHGVLVTHGDMQEYSDSLNHIHEKSGDVAVNPCIFWNREHETGGVGSSNDGSDFYMYHYYQKLWYRMQNSGDGGEVEIVSSGELTSLPESLTMTSFDLDTIDNLAYGQLYRVKNVEFAKEEPT